MKRKQAKRKAEKKAKEEKEGNGVSLKDQGTKAFSEKRYEEAIRLFTDAVAEDPSNSILYSNRSACYSANLQFDAALKDAEDTIRLAPTWSKGYLRRGQALEGLMQLQKAYEAYREGQSKDENDAVIKRSLDELCVLMEDMKLSATEASQTVNPEEDRFEAMQTWLKEGNAQFPYLYLRYYDEDYRGVHAVTKIPNNRIILEVPLSHIMTSDVAKASDIGQKIIKSGCELNSTHSYLASYLLQEKHNPLSFWKPYIRILPQHYKNMPIFFDGHDLDLLKGSFSIRKIIDRQEELKEEFENICRSQHHLTPTLAPHCTARPFLAVVTCDNTVPHLRRSTT
jgi:tetratricopeptide (TPR) repeat protein